MFHLFGGKERKDADPENEYLEQALDRSTHELQILANFYHQHSYPERAQEIYRTILKLRRDREKKGEKKRA